MRSRPNAFSTEAVVSSSSLQASYAGTRVLEAGGNIVDAAIATSAVLCVTQNNLCGLGGDTFVLLQIDGKPVIDLNGSGRSFENASIENYTKKGLKEIPHRGPEAVVTVPGIVRAWADLHKRYCTMEVKDLLKYAFSLANEGYPITQNYSESIGISYKYLSAYPGWKDVFAPGGVIPSSGTIFKQKDLARTLGTLMSDGLSSFYDGVLADKITNGLNDLGVEITSDDLKNHTSTFQEPLETDFNEFKIFETAPNSQAATAILWLNMLGHTGQPYSLKNVLSTGMIAYSQRDRYITDPDFFALPEDFTSKRFARDLLDTKVQWQEEGSTARDRGDTVYFSITDSSMNSISVIQSNFMGFGTGIVPAGTGLVLQNRGIYFSLDPAHHNSLQPRKRTFHTLCAGMIKKGSDFVSSFGSMGGDIQPQLHMQLLLGIMKHTGDPQTVLDTPRWAFPYSIYEKPREIICESEDLEREIKKSFPDRNVRNRGFSSEFGHAQITARLENGTVVGGADPRGDGVSLPVIVV